MHKNLRIARQFLKNKFTLQLLLNDRSGIRRGFGDLREAVRGESGATAKPSLPTLRNNGPLRWRESGQYRGAGPAHSL